MSQSSVFVYPEPNLTDGVVTLRPWRDDDLACVEAASVDPYIPDFTSVPRDYSAQAGLAYIQRQRQRVVDSDGLPFAIADEATDEALGFIGINRRPQLAVFGLGYWVIAPARGRGLVRRAVTLASNFAFAHLAAARVEAWIEPDNEASHRVITAAGFEREGVLRSFLSYGERRADAVVYSRVSSPR